MAAYTDYGYYVSTFLGVVISVSEADRLLLRASELIDALTYGRAAGVVLAAIDTATIDKIKMATCAVAEKLKEVEASGGSDAIQSESIGQNSVTYADNAYARLTSGRKLWLTATLYLGSTGLMFSGFLSGEYGGELDSGDED